MQRFNTFNTWEKADKKEYDFQKWLEEKTKTGEYIVDDSKFTPMAEQVRAMRGTAKGGITETEARQAFDYMPGQDTSKMPMRETKRGKDLAQIAMEMNAAENKITKEIKEQTTKIKRAKELNIT